MMQFKCIILRRCVVGSVGAGACGASPSTSVLHPRQDVPKDARKDRARAHTLRHGKYATVNDRGYIISVCIKHSVH